MKWPTVAALTVLASCSSSPIPRTYVLNAPADPVPRALSEAGRQVLEVHRVVLPDYLDSNDIQSRDGQNEMKVSQTGRWGERLSEGITDTLAADLQRRLPAVLVTRSARSTQSARRLLVDVDAFDVRSDGTCVLIVRWRMDQAEGSEHRESFVTHAARTADGISDAAIVAAMAAAIDQLAGRIAGTRL